MATTKKAKSASSRKTTSSEPEVSPSVHTAKNTSPLSVKLSKKYVMIGIAVVVIAALLYTFRSLFIVATVNGQPVSRLAVIQELEKQGGKQTLNNLITKTLIEQESAKKNVSISQKEIDDEIKKIETNVSKQGQTLDQLLQLQGMSRENLATQIKTQKQVEKLVGPVTISEKEITAYIETNKASIPAGTNMEEVKKTAKEQLQQQKISEKAQALLQKLQKDAKITYMMTY